MDRLARHRSWGGTAVFAALALFFLLLWCADASAAASGSRLWAKRYVLSGPFEGGWSAVGRDGSFHICGARIVPPSDVAPYVVKYSRTGLRRWVREQPHWSGRPSVVKDIGVDKYGNVYTCGTVTWSSSDTDVLVLKHAPNGDLRWLQTWEIAPGRKEAANALTVTPGGAVYVAGEYESTTGDGADFLMMRWTSAGSVKWVWTHDAEGRDDIATDVALDGAGGVAFTGTVTRSAGDLDCRTVRLNTTDGALRGPIPFQTYAGGAGGNEDDPRLARGPKHSIYVALESYAGPARGTDIVLLRYGADGKRRWTRRYDGPDHLDDDLAALAVDAYGSAFLAGTSDRATGPEHSALALRYSGSGTRKWAKSYRQTKAGRAARYFDVVVDGSGRPYFGGVRGDDAGQDVLLSAYSRTGKLRWRRTYDGPAHLGDAAVSLATYGTATLYVSGASHFGAMDYRGLVMKYRQ